jgi:hypothetical protein
MKQNIGVPAIIGGVVALLAVIGAIYYFAGGASAGDTAGVAKAPAGTGAEAGKQYGAQYGQQMADKMKNGGARR